MAVIKNASSGKVIAGRVERADNFVTRGLGLLPRATVEADEGLWIDQCSAVHTIGMRATIDLFFIDREGTVLRIVQGARPNRLVYSCPKAFSVVELGTNPDCARDVLVGDRLVLE